MDNSTSKAGKYFEAVGRRKTAVARVRILPSAKNSYMINGKEYSEYFHTNVQRNVVHLPINENKLPEKFKITAIVYGGGMSSQAEAVRHGISRALLVYDSTLRKNLKKSGFLKRDPRSKERRKFGLKKARKAPQWSKR